MHNRTLTTLLRREVYRFARLTQQTIAPPIVTTILFIVIFGFALGGQIREISGHTYIFYILPGIAALGVVTNAYSNTSTSLYAARFDRSIENWLTLPIAPLQLVVALITGGVLRGLVIGVLTLVVAMVAIDLPVVNPLLAVAWFAGTGVAFSCLGIVSGLRANSWDHLATMTNFVLTPGTYLGGVFYSLHMLPEPWHTISRANPIFYCIDGLRHAVLGTSDIPWTVSGSVLLGIDLAGVLVCWALLKRGYRLVK